MLTAVQANVCIEPFACVLVLLRLPSLYCCCCCRLPGSEKTTAQIAQEMLAAGFKAVVACLDPKKLPASLAGRAWDQALLSELPTDVDPCGEVRCKTSWSACRLDSLTCVFASASLLGSRCSGCSSGQYCCLGSRPCSCQRGAASAAYSHRQQVQAAGWGGQGPALQT